MIDHSPTLNKLRQQKRFELKLLLDLLNPENHKVFKLMYARNNGKRSVEDALIMSLDKIVEEIPEDKLDLAICQCENQISKNKNKAQ